MTKLALVILTALLAAPLAAQDIGLTVELGISGLVRGPFTTARVRVLRGGGDAFKGRVTVKLAERAAMGRGLEFVSDFSHEISLGAGENERAVEILLPVSAGALFGKAVLEREEGGRYVEVTDAARDFHSGLFTGQLPLVGFISPVRLVALSGFVDYAMWEITQDQLPRDWRALLCYDAIILNHEGLDNEHYDALTNYVAAGGTLVMSSHTAAFFAPGTPGAELVGVRTLPDRVMKSLSEYGVLTQKLVKPSKETLPAIAQAHIGLWKFSSARLKGGGPGDPRFPLFSIARCGGGRVALVHTDISLAPFASVETRLPTAAGGHLLDLALGECLVHGAGRTPLDVLLAPPTAHALDIAGTRVPGHQVVVVVIVLYVVAAGIGMSMLARKLRRPELYPAGLLALAVVAVVAALGLGGIVKAAGERVLAARYIVSAPDDARQGVFSVGCAYALDAEAYRFIAEPGVGLNPRTSFGGDAMMQGPTVWRMDAMTTGKETTMALREVARGQNIYFDQTSQRKSGGMHLRTTRFAGGLGIENLGDAEVRGCVVVVAAEIAGGGTEGLEWHYVKRIGPAGKQDARVTLDKSTVLTGDAGTLLARWDAEFGGASAEHAALRRLLALDTDQLLIGNSFSKAAGTLKSAGLLSYVKNAPLPDQYVLIGALAPNAVSAQTLGTPAEPGAIRQACVWCVQGWLE